MSKINDLLLKTEEQLTNKEREEIWRERKYEWETAEMHRIQEMWNKVYKHFLKGEDSTR